MQDRPPLAYMLVACARNLFECKTRFLRAIATEIVVHPYALIAIEMLCAMAMATCWLPEVNAAAIATATDTVASPPPAKKCQAVSAMMF